MEPGVQAALADELLNTVIHKFQIPGSKTQVIVQAIAIHALMEEIERNTPVTFDDAKTLLADTVLQMPGCSGGVPHVFYELRTAIEYSLSQDPLLQHVVKVNAVRGCRNDLDFTLPVLRDPRIPDDLKEELMEGSISLIPDMDTLESVRYLILELGRVENQAKDLLWIAGYARSAEVGEELKVLAVSHDFNTLLNMKVDFLAMDELVARADKVLDGIFYDWRASHYDKKPIGTA